MATKEQKQQLENASLQLNGVIQKIADADVKDCEIREIMFRLEDLESELDGWLNNTLAEDE